MLPVRLPGKQILRPLASGIYKAEAMIVIDLPDDAATASLAARLAAPGNHPEAGPVGDGAPRAPGAGGRSRRRLGSAACRPRGGTHLKCCSLAVRASRRALRALLSMR